MYLMIVSKMIYQLPLFCSTSEFTFSFTESCKKMQINSYYLYQRWEYLIGIHKFYGESSFPKNIGLFNGLIWDYLCLLSILFHKSIVIRQGIWDYVRLDRDSRVNPCFNLLRFRRKFLDERRDLSLEHSQGEESSFVSSSEENSSLISIEQTLGLSEDPHPSHWKRIKKSWVNAFYRNFPYYLKRKPKP